jgi:hypothetical protein
MKINFYQIKNPGKRNAVCQADSTFFLQKWLGGDIMPRIGEGIMIDNKHYVVIYTIHLQTGCVNIFVDRRK